MLNSCRRLCQRSVWAELLAGGAGAAHESQAMAEVPQANPHFGHTEPARVKVDPSDLPEVLDGLYQSSRQDLVQAGWAEASENLELTPAQRFFQENREALLARAKTYFEAKAQGLKTEEDEATFYSDPIRRPPKGFLWEARPTNDLRPEPAEAPRIPEILFQMGTLPTIDKLANLLVREKAEDVTILDLDHLQKRDRGLFMIVATGRTPQHCRRLGALVSKTVRELQIPHMDVYCWATRGNEWVTARCGPYMITLLTPELRGAYNFEGLLTQDPETFGTPEEFPQYAHTFHPFADSQVEEPPNVEALALEDPPESCHRRRSRAASPVVPDYSQRVQEAEDYESLM